MTPKFQCFKATKIMFWQGLFSSVLSVSPQHVVTPCGDSVLQAALIWWLCIHKTRPSLDHGSRRKERD